MFYTKDVSVTDNLSLGRFVDTTISLAESKEKISKLQINFAINILFNFIQIQSVSVCKIKDTIVCKFTFSITS